MRFEEISHTLLDRARKQDADALEDLCLAVQPGAYAVLMTLLRNTEDAADCLQDSLIRLVRFMPDLKDNAAFPGWLMRLLVNQAATLKRRPVPLVVDITEMGDSESSEAMLSTASAPASPRRIAESHEMGRLIQQAIGKLPERQHTALVLFEVERLPTAEVARIMGITDGAVKFHIHEARKSVRNHLIGLGIVTAKLSEGDAG